MPISFICPHCSARKTVFDASAVHAGLCSNCGQLITIPGVVFEASGTRGILLAARSPSSFRKAIVMLLATIGAFVCCGGLLRSLNSATGDVRSSARRSECSNHLKAIALAMHEYHDTYKCFPPAYVADEVGRPMHSWRVLLLPYLGLPALYDQYDFNEPWDGPNNRLLVDRIGNTYRCPSDPGSPAATCYMVITGPGTMFEGTNCTSIEDVSDGMSETLFIVEVAKSRTNWMKPVDLDARTMDMFIGDADAGDGIASYHPGTLRNEPGVANVAMADGSIRFLEASTGKDVLAAMITKDAGD